MLTIYPIISKISGAKSPVTEISEKKIFLENLSAPRDPVVCSQPENVAPFTNGNFEKFIPQ